MCLVEIQVFNRISKITLQQKSLLESLNLELYASSEGDEYVFGENHIGRLWFELEYDSDRQRISVCVGKVRNLPNHNYGKEVCNNFFIRQVGSLALFCKIKVYLSPFDRQFAQTKTKRKTLNPKFDEVIIFDHHQLLLLMFKIDYGQMKKLSPDHFDERSLKFVIYRVDTLMRALPFGQVIFPLKDYTIKRKKRVTFWRDFERNVTDIPIVTSEIHCSLVYYENLQRLTLTVMEANDLNLTGNNESWGVFLKVELCLGARKLKTKKSQVVKKTRSPVFNQSFSFSISPERIDEASIHIQLYQTKPYKLVGRLILGGYMFTRDKPLQHWQEMLANMKTAKRHNLHDQNETTWPCCHCPKHLQGHTSSWRPVKYKKPPGSGPILKASPLEVTTVPFGPFGL
ncbi:Synaptotagmin-15 [Trichinella patagoniensis]|uniref:Synaptotagmin-15 n=1 Tax=Trichinella patagoniensis TaxID=990121 RepID=A0A0V0ZL66_9BILA|nr:Synaptotagmin-15 [Trichinella patagoniensis]